MDMSLDELTGPRPARGGKGGRGGRRGAGAVMSAGARDAASPIKRPAPKSAAGARNRVYVHNLDWAVTWQILKDHMRAAGEVTRADVLMKPSGLSKGCGIVEFATPAQAQAAIRTLNDTMLLDRQILVREDQQDRAAPEPAARGGSAVGRAAASAKAHGGVGAFTRVFVGNLPFRLTWAELKDAFKHFGEVAYANVELNPDGRSKGWGVVDFVHPGDARKATSSNISLDGREVEVREDRNGSFRSSGAAAAPVHVQDNKRVYVGNLSWEVEWQDLKDYFKSCGEVLRADVFKYADGRSRGCGLVEFVSARSAANAIASLNDTELKGRVIFVREDNKDVGGASAAPAPAPAAGGSPSTRVFVGNLPFSVTAQNLKDEFSSVGPVAHAEVVAGFDGRSKGFGFITFSRIADAHKAIATYTGATMDGRVMEIHFDMK